MSGGLGLKEEANMSSCIEKERQALLDVKASVIDLHGNLSDWGEKKDCCKWVGVTCNNHTGHVIKLDLSFGPSAFTGKISPSLQVLNQLQFLNLSGINFQSNPLPSLLGSLSNLQSLDISGANLSGPIPHQLANLSNLLRLDLSFNFLGGSIPKSFENCSSLLNLDLSHNLLNGPLPSFARCSSLISLSIAHNSLNGSMPDFTGCISLHYLDLSSNFLSGIMPVGVSQLSNLGHLDVSHNSLNGSIPNFIGCPSLSYLDLSSNQLSDLSNNRFKGIVPRLPTLATLNLSGNRFSGNLSFLCEIDGALTFLDLSNNSLSGSLPGCWLNFQERLVILNLSNNNLSGNIPSSLGFLSNLEVLYLRTNAFVGELPMSLSNCTKLRFADFGENKLSGVIPEWIEEKLSDLYILVLGSNGFKGRIPSQICWLYNLQVLDVSNNGLSGNIPRCFHNFTAMARRSFGDDMTNHSYSSYRRPPFFSAPLALRPYIQCGRIPTGSQLQCFNYTSYSDNPKLFGPPLTPRCGLQPPPATNVGKEDVEEDDDDLWKSYYTGMGAGFAVAFWGICGSLLLSCRCRYFVFASLSHMKDWIYVTMVVHFGKLGRKFRR
ncbi:hypothetical protein L1987_75299 [Smallanthus sonchifolius]|uniref:Uncharacterized protein n=1 Tax=Smallanthus sonchifolius TaxID=185202 RepID=A0ACB9A4B0_9ASTR|nr:hypothetical protein L1987_75299 [Smallanthus sonchifolius]